MKRRIFLALLAVYTLTFTSQAQRNNENAGLYEINNTNNAVQNLHQPPAVMDSEEEMLLKQLSAARLSNNTAEAKRLFDILNSKSNSSSTPFVNNPELTGMLITETQGNQTKPPFMESDYHVSTILTGAFWAVATATSNRSTAIFAAVTQYIQGGGDELKIYVSYNGGATWVLKNTFTGFSSTVDYRPGELDIEPVINGNDTLLYCVAGYTFNGHALSQIYRVNITDGSGLSNIWSFGGSLNPVTNTYNPKITSDNTRYPSSYIYITASFDSAGTTRYTSRFCIIDDPFTASTLTYRLPGGVGFWFSSNGLPSPAYLWQDICYYFSAGSLDRIYTVYNHAGSTSQNQSLYIAWSDNYGVSVVGSLIALQSSNIQGAILAASGGSSQSVAIGFRKLNGTQWDYVLNHSNNGGMSGTFTSYTLESTPDTTITISLQGIDLGNGRYVTAHSRNGGEHFYRYFNNGILDNQIQTNHIPGDYSFGGCQAGYWNTANADSSLVLWSSGIGSNVYCSRLLNSTVGIYNHGSELPLSYSLSQNFPNPFNPVTKINFSLPGAGLVKLAVYDVTGREVASLINQNMNAGNYSVDFNAVNLASGVYFYTIRAGSFTDTRKMILIK